MSEALSTSQPHASASASASATMAAFSPGYGAPEQFDGRFGATGPWTDVFAFALVIVELLTGRPALDGADPVQLFFSATHPMRRPTPRARGAIVGDAVEQVLARALAVEPSQRYASVEPMWRSLKEAVRDDHLRASEGAKHTRTRTRTNRTPLVAVFAAVGPLGVGAAAFTTGGNRSPRRPPSRRSRARRLRRRARARPHRVQRRLRRSAWPNIRRPPSTKRHATLKPFARATF